MAPRPSKSNASNTSKRRSSSSSKAPKSQSEINRVKPNGTLSLDVLNKASQRIITINVKFPDGEIYEFYHLPMTFNAAEDFLATATDGTQIDALRSLLVDLLVNKDGSPFADADAWMNVDVQIIKNIHTAIISSSQEEGGED